MTTELTIPPEQTPGVAVPFRQKEATLNGEDRYSGDSAIQDALDDAATGDAIIVGPGTYADNVTVSTDNVTIIGAGRGTLVDGGTGGDAILVSGASDVTVQNLAVQTTSGGGNSNDGIRINNAGGVACNRTSVITVWAEESDQHGIHHSSGKDCTFVNIRSTGADGMGLNINGGVGAIVTAVTARQNGGNGIKIGPGKSMLYGAIAVGNSSGDGVKATQNNQIITHVKADNNNNGVVLTGTDQIVDDCQLINNTTTNLDTSSATTPVTGENITA